MRGSCQAISLRRKAHIWEPKGTVHESVTFCKAYLRTSTNSILWSRDNTKMDQASASVIDHKLGIHETSLANLRAQLSDFLLGLISVHRL